MALSPDDLAALLAAFEDSEWTEMSLTVDGIRLQLTRTGAAGEVEPDSPAPEPPGSAHAEERHEVRAPCAGIFYRAPAPGAKPFAEVGARVGPEDVLCIVEVMKLMNHVQAGTAGAVASVHVENGETIEHAQLLFTIADAG